MRLPISFGSTLSSLFIRLSDVKGTIFKTSLGTCVSPSVGKNEVGIQLSVYSRDEVVMTREPTIVRRGKD